MGVYVCPYGIIRTNRKTLDLQRVERFVLILFPLKRPPKWGPGRGAKKRVARKYGVDFALKKDPEQGKYLVFFKSRDADALNAAFAEYTARTLHRSGPKRPSLLAVNADLKL